MQIVFCSKITLIVINYIFFGCITGGTWMLCVAMSNFLMTAKNTTGPGWSSVANAGTSMG